mmetsp:Transcript_17550/g.31669  ORF Transcript_17550/g.31669 Transcript_17550/m.31669 type:complete len:475 (-) Transcript_17550:335-1759(-)
MRNQVGDDIGAVRELAAETIEKLFDSSKKQLVVLEKLTSIPKNAELDSWELIQNSMRLEFHKLVSASTSGTLVEMLNSVLRAVSLKENLLTQSIRGLLHKKLLLWYDLDIREEEYAKTEVVEATKFIMDFSEVHGYFPTRIDYFHPVRSANALPSLYDKRPSFSTEGDSVSIMSSFSEAFFAMQHLIENNFRLSTKPKKKVAKVKSLREEIESLTHKIESMENEMFSIKSLMRNPDRREWIQINKENESLRKELDGINKTMQRINLDRANLEAEYELKKKSYNSLQTKLNDVNEIYMPRVNEIQELQQQILAELQQIRQDAELLPVMFRNEANMKAIIIDEKLEAERRMNAALTAMEEHKSNAKKYFEERNRKEKIALQAIAARNTVTTQLKDVTARCNELEKRLAELTDSSQFTEAEFKQFKAQFDVLQSQVFIQNNRINELEDQKKLLIDQLKSMGGISKAHHTHKRLNPES